MPGFCKYVSNSPLFSGPHLHLDLSNTTLSKIITTGKILEWKSNNGNGLEVMVIRILKHLDRLLLAMILI
jgi:hypothetical protein